MYAEQFLENYGYNYQKRFNVLDEFSNLSNVWLTEYNNQKQLLESCMDYDTRILIEAKLDVLQEGVFETLWKKIKSFFAFLLDKWRGFLNHFRKKSGKTVLDSAKNDLERCKILFKNGSMIKGIGIGTLSKVFMAVNPNIAYENYDKLLKIIEDKGTSDLARRWISIIFNWQCYFRLESFAKLGNVTVFNMEIDKSVDIVTKAIKGGIKGAIAKKQINGAYRDLKSLIFVPHVSGLDEKISQSIYSKGEDGSIKLNPDVAKNVIRVATAYGYMQEVISKYGNDAESYISWLENQIEVLKKDSTTCEGWISTVNKVLVESQQKMEAALKPTDDGKEKKNVAELSGVVQQFVSLIRFQSDLMNVYATCIRNADIALKGVTTKLYQLFMDMAKKQKEGSKNESYDMSLGEAVEDNASNLKQAKKAYKEIIAACKTKSESKEIIQGKIKELKICVREMEKQKKDTDRNYEHSKYILKSAIPFNNIYRAIKLGDPTAKMAWITNLFVPFGAVVRSLGYKDMLDYMIKNTNEAIEYLEKQLKEM